MAEFPDNGNGDSPNAKRGRAKSPMRPEVIEIVEPRCKVCKSKYRHQMEEMMLRGMSFSSIGRFFEQLGEDVNRKNLASHKENHMALEKAALRRVIERRAREALIDVDEAEDYIMTKHGMLEAMLHKAWERMQADEMEWSPKDVMAIMQYIERLEAQHQNIALDEIMLEARCFSEAVKSLVPAQSWESIVARFEMNVKRAKNPIMTIEVESSNGA